MKHPACAKTFTKSRQAVSYIYRQTAILSFFKDLDRLYQPEFILAQIFWMKKRVWLMPNPQG